MIKHYTDHLIYKIIKIFKPIEVQGIMSFKNILKVRRHFIPLRQNLCTQQKSDKNIGK